VFKASDVEEELVSLPSAMAPSEAKAELPRPVLGASDVEEQVASASGMAPNEKIAKLPSPVIGANTVEEAVASLPSAMEDVSLDPSAERDAEGRTERWADRRSAKPSPIKGERALSQAEGRVERRVGEVTHNACTERDHRAGRRGDRRATSLEGKPAGREPEGRTERRSAQVTPIEAEADEREAEGRAEQRAERRETTRPPFTTVRDATSASDTEEGDDWEDEHRGTIEGGGPGWVQDIDTEEGDEFGDGLRGTMEGGGPGWSHDIDTEEGDDWEDELRGTLKGGGPRGAVNIDTQGRGDDFAFSLESPLRQRPRSSVSGQKRRIIVSPSGASADEEPAPARHTPLESVDLRQNAQHVSKERDVSAASRAGKLQPESVDLSEEAPDTAAPKPKASYGNAANLNSRRPNPSAPPPSPSSAPKPKQLSKYVSNRDADTTAWEGHAPAPPPPPASSAAKPKQISQPGFSGYSDMRTWDEPNVSALGNPGRLNPEDVASGSKRGRERREAERFSGARSPPLAPSVPVSASVNLVDSPVRPVPRHKGTAALPNHTESRQGQELQGQERAASLPNHTESRKGLEGAAALPEQAEPRKGQKAAVSSHHQLTDSDAEEMHEAQEMTDANIWAMGNRPLSPGSPSFERSASASGVGGEANPISIDSGPRDESDDVPITDTAANPSTFPFAAPSTAASAPAPTASANPAPSNPAKRPRTPQLPDDSSPMYGPATRAQSPGGDDAPGLDDPADFVDLAADPPPAEPSGLPSCILYIDSLASSREEGINILKYYLEEEWNAKIRPTCSTAVEAPQFRHMPTKKVRVTQQHNHSDCGLYMLKYVEKFSLYGATLEPLLESSPGKPKWNDYAKLTFGKAEIEQMRKKMHTDIERLGKEQRGSGGGE
jgi:hypothetical protein